MRIAMLATPPVGAHGWASYARDLITALAQRGSEIVLITSSDAPPTVDLPVAGYHRLLPSITPPVRWLNLRLLAARYAVSRLVRECDLVHISAEPFAICAPADKPLIVTAHGTYLPRTLAGKLGWLYRRAYRRAVILCVSSYTQQQVKIALPEANTKVILNGVDFAKFQTQTPIPRKSAAPTIVAVGQHKARKGFHILARAMSQIRAAVPDVRAVFAGSDSDTAYVASIREILKRDGTADIVRIAGRISDADLLELLHTADLFALPAINTADGKFEGFGLVYLEASAAGLPVIGTLDCGAEDAIRDGETGFLIAQNDPEALAETAIQLLRDANLRSRMGAAGRQWAEVNSWQQVAARVSDVYATVIRRTPHRG
ncbi:MAG: glycosyltransferase family 4 protein [Anaerolineae bacterium]|nr:glycosyltransferase family 4 protein [Anaerolineae bacterium]